jgi:hypothetical protein
VAVQRLATNPVSSEIDLTVEYKPEPYPWLRVKCRSPLRFRKMIRKRMILLRSG